MRKSHDEHIWWERVDQIISSERVRCRDHSSNQETFERISPRFSENLSPFFSSVSEKVPIIWIFGAQFTLHHFIIWYEWTISIRSFNSMVEQFWLDCWNFSIWLIVLLKKTFVNAFWVEIAQVSWCWGCDNKQEEEEKDRNHCRYLHYYETSISKRQDFFWTKNQPE